MILQKTQIKNKLHRLEDLKKYGFNFNIYSMAEVNNTGKDGKQKKSLYFSKIMHKIKEVKKENKKNEIKLIRTQRLSSFNNQDLPSSSSPTQQVTKKPAESKLAGN